MDGGKGHCACVKGRCAVWITERNDNNSGQGSTGPDLLERLERSDFPGSPPSLAQAGEPPVAVVEGARTRLSSVVITGELVANDATIGDGKTSATLTIPLRELRKGRQRGRDATLTAGDRSWRAGAWIVELTVAAPGQLKNLGPCDGRLAVTFTREVYVVGTFHGGCLTH
jgi:hypothetical protein